MITKYGKNQHFKEKHPDSDLCICQNCGQKFHTSESLRKHIEYKHLDVGDFPCPWVWKQCYKRYKTKQALKKHIRDSHIHNQEMPCSTCGKLVPKYKMNLHIQMVHTRGKYMSEIRKS